MDDGLPERRRLRLSAYDYATPGAYFVTICTHEKRCSLGFVDDSVGQAPCACRLSQAGAIIEEEIRKLGLLYENVSVDKYVIMPNHVHLLLALRQAQGACPTLGSIINGFKARVTKAVRTAGLYANVPFWQPRFYDHVVRDESDYERIWEYIENNPARWRDDELYCERLCYAP